MNRSSFAKNERPSSPRLPIAVGQIWVSPDWMDFGFCKAKCKLQIEMLNPFNNKWDLKIVDWQMSSGINGGSLMGMAFSLTAEEIYKSLELETRQIKTPNGHKSITTNNFRETVEDQSVDEDIPF